jgi:hypothetical protein
MFINPDAYSGLTQTAGQVGGNAAQAGIGYAAPLRSAKAGQQSAFQGLAMARINATGSRRKQMDAIQRELARMGYKNNEAGVLDYLSLIPGIASTVKGIEQYDQHFGG